MLYELVVYRLRMLRFIKLPPVSYIHPLSGCFYLSFHFHLLSRSIFHIFKQNCEPGSISLLLPTSCERHSGYTTDASERQNTYTSGPNINNATQEYGHMYFKFY